MASNQTPTDPDDLPQTRGRRPNHDNNDNPFIAFRRYADQQISSLLDTVFNLPSAMASAQSERHQYPFHERAANDKQRDQVGDAQENDEERETDPFTRLVKDLDEAVDSEWKRFKQAFADEGEGEEKEGDSSWVKDEDGTRRRHWNWSWSYPPRGKDGEEQRKEDRHEDADQMLDLVRGSWRDIEDRFMRNPSFASPWDSFIHSHFGFHDFHPINPMLSPAYLLFSSYSPMRLEQDPWMARAGKPWRNAFEDLVRVDAGLPMLGSTQSSSSPKQLEARHPVSWVPERELEEYRAFLRRDDGQEESKEDAPAEPAGQSCPYFNDNDTRRAYPDFEPDDDAPNNEPNVRPNTELDMYDRFLGPPQQSQTQSLPTVPVTSTSTSQTPSVLSTLTTTERTTGPDGTVTTRIVLKKRFADGREESSETVHTTQGGPGSSGDGEGSFRAMQDAQTQTGEEGQGRKRGGWFWSG